MKRLLSLMVALGVIFVASAAFAGVDTTPHEFGTAAYGMCEVCHVPHAASAVTDERLWRVDRTIVTDGTYDNSTIGQLCGTCHNGGVGDAWTNINGISATTQATLAYDETHHDRDWNVLVGASPNLADTQDTNIGLKPYASGTKIEAGLMECTSCHNPHQNAVRPFLRENTLTGAGTISGVCADCHYNRYSEIIFDGVTGTGDDNHPVNVLYIDNGGTGMDNGNTTFRLVPYTTLITLVNAETYGTDGGSTWPLGGKMEGELTAAPGNWNTADIGCGTCHSVHDPAATTTAGEEALHLLAVDNTGVGAKLCEGCHGGPLNQPFSAYSQVGIGSDHPIDMLPGTGGGPLIDRWYAQAGATTRDERTATGDTQWARGSGGNIICTSCHSAHRSMSFYERLTRDNWNVAINVEDSFCTACHSSPSPLAHHSHESNSNSSVTCGYCHGGGTGAHNGFNYTFTDAQNQYSNLCAMCHIWNTGVGGGGDPTTIDQTEATSWAQQDPATYSPDTLVQGAVSYEVHLDGAPGVSHYLGTFKNNSTTVWVKRSNWAYGKSKYGGTKAATNWGDPAGAADPNNVMICESCHNVLYNFGAESSIATITSGWENDLLLMDYRDDQTNNANARGVGSGFCVGCHNQNNAGSAAGVVAHSTVELSGTVPIGTHPMTAWSVTRAVDAGRAITTLVTRSVDGTYADAALSIGGGGALATNESYPAQDNMDCDSCHAPHEAQGDPATNIGSYDTTQTQPGTKIPVIIENAGPSDYEYENLCLDCHNY